MATSKSLPDPPSLESLREQAKNSHATLPPVTPGHSTLAADAPRTTTLRISFHSLKANLLNPHSNCSRPLDGGRV